MLPDQVAHQDAQDFGRVGGEVLGPGEGLAPPEGVLGQLEDVDGRLLAQERLTAVVDA